MQPVAKLALLIRDGIGKTRVVPSGGVQISVPADAVVGALSIKSVGRPRDSHLIVESVIGHKQRGINHILIVSNVEEVDFTESEIRSSFKGFGFSCCFTVRSEVAQLN